MVTGPSLKQTASFGTTTFPYVPDANSPVQTVSGEAANTLVEPPVTKQIPNSAQAPMRNFIRCPPSPLLLLLFASFMASYSNLGISRQVSASQGVREADEGRGEEPRVRGGRAAPRRSE